MKQVEHDDLPFDSEGIPGDCTRVNALCGRDSGVSEPSLGGGSLCAVTSLWRSPDRPQALQKAGPMRGVQKTCPQRI